MDVLAAALRPEVVVVLSVVVASFAGFAVCVLCFLAGRDEGPQLRRCPVCKADAVRVAATEPTTAIAVRIELQCGQCGTWRRVVATTDISRRHRRGVERQLELIRDEAVRLESQRAFLDCTAFITTLRSAEMVGPADFLACTRGAQREHAGGDA